MPELPDIVLYVEALRDRILGQPLQQARVMHPFLLRTAEPPVTAAEQKEVTQVRRIAKRVAIGLENDLWLVIHLMIAGRLHWRKPGSVLRAKADLAGFYFPTGTLVLTESGTKKRAALHVLLGEEGLNALDPGGIDVLQADLSVFSSALTAENHTVKRALTDPHLFSGIGNAYSDEILFRARMSPASLTQHLSADRIRDLYEASQKTLVEWIDRLRKDIGAGFPEKVTAFHADMAVHGRFRKPCSVCGSPIQRIRYAENESNYCAHCQTGGKLLADRALSRLLKKDWPRSLDELEKRYGRGGLHE
jgi:formamidopyrimidine-DNA glycosylase